MKIKKQSKIIIFTIIISTLFCYIYNSTVVFGQSVDVNNYEEMYSLYLKYYSGEDTTTLNNIKYDSKALIKNFSNNDSSDDYYYLSYFTNGMLEYYESTNDKVSLDKAISLIDGMIKAAEPYKKGDDYRPWKYNGTDMSMTYLQQSLVPIAKAAYLISRTNSVDYDANKAAIYVKFVDDVLIDYYFRNADELTDQYHRAFCWTTTNTVNGKTVYSIAEKDGLFCRRIPYLREDEAQILTNQWNKDGKLFPGSNEYRSTWIDRNSNFGLTSLYLFEATNNLSDKTNLTLYKKIAKTISSALKTRFLKGEVQYKDDDGSSKKYYLIDNDIKSDNYKTTWIKESHSWCTFYLLSSAGKETLSYRDPSGSAQRYTDTSGNVTTGSYNEKVDQKCVISVADRTKYEKNGTKISKVEFGYKTVYDTSHANREISYITTLYDFKLADINSAQLITDDTINAFSNLFLKNIWDKDNSSPISPQYNNYIDGSNDLFRASKANENGKIYSGWASLGKYNEQINNLLIATYKNGILTSSNQGLNYANNNGYTHIGMAATLTSNKRYVVSNPETVADKPVSSTEKNSNTPSAEAPVDAQIIPIGVPVIFSGETYPDTEIRILLNNQDIGKTTSDSDGNWEFTYDAGSVKGVSVLKAIINDNGTDIEIATKTFKTEEKSNLILYIIIGSILFVIASTLTLLIVRRRNKKKVLRIEPEVITESIETNYFK